LRAPKPLSARQPSVRRGCRSFCPCAVDNFTQEHNGVTPLAHGDVEILKARQSLGELGQLVIVRGEQGFRANGVVQVLDDTPREAQAVEGARAAPDFVQHDEAARVALLRMFAVSVISTMKVLCPRAKSSLAPMRVKMRSTRSMRASAAGTNDPVCARSVMSATCRMYVDLPACWAQ